MPAGLMYCWIEVVNVPNLHKSRFGAVLILCEYWRSYEPYEISIRLHACSAIYTILACNALPCFALTQRCVEVALLPSSGRAGFELGPGLEASLSTLSIVARTCNANTQQGWLRTFLRVLEHLWLETELSPPPTLFIDSLRSERSVRIGNCTRIKRNYPLSVLQSFLASFFLVIVIASSLVS